MFLYLQVLINKKDKYKDKKKNKLQHRPTTSGVEFKFKRVSIICLIQGIDIIKSIHIGVI
jgi:hypothetical protein